MTNGLLAAGDPQPVFVKEDLKLSDAVETPYLRFHLPDKKRGQTRSVDVIVGLRNLNAADVGWICDLDSDVVAEVIGVDGKVVSPKVDPGKISTESFTYTIPHGWHRRWRVSYGERYRKGGTDDVVDLRLGGKLWVLPLATLSSYKLKLRVRGIVGTRKDGEMVELLDMPAVPIVISP